MLLFREDLPFFRGNLHTHTTMSDGRCTPEEAMRLYRAAGYDFLALTDHRTITRPERAPEGLTLIPGIELDHTFPTQVCHIVGLGVDQSVAEGFDTQAEPQRSIDLIRACGGLAILCHPAWSLNTPAFMASLRGLSGAEVWNSVSTLPYNTLRSDSSSLLDVCAAQGAILPLLANDDCHFYGQDLAAGWNMVQAEENTAEQLLNALRAGRFYATQGPAFRQIEVTEREIRVHCSPVSCITFASDRVWVAGRSHVGEALTEAVYPLVQPGEQFVRVQLIDAQGRNAWSSPIRVGADAR